MLVSCRRLFSGSLGKQALVFQGVKCFGSSWVSLGVSHVDDGQLRIQGVHKSLHQLVWCRHGLIFGTFPPTPPCDVEIDESQQTGGALYKHHCSCLLVFLQTLLCSDTSSGPVTVIVLLLCSPNWVPSSSVELFFQLVSFHLLPFVMHLGRCSLI